MHFNIIAKHFNGNSIVVEINTATGDRWKMPNTNLDLSPSTIPSESLQHSPPIMVELVEDGPFSINIKRKYDNVGVVSFSGLVFRERWLQMDISLPVDDSKQAHVSTSASTHQTLRNLNNGPFFS